jgi:hypothetical protein
MGSLNLHKKVFVSFSYPFLSRAFSWQSPKYEDDEISSRQSFSFFISFSVERYAFLHISLASYTFFNNTVIWHTLSKRRLFWDKLAIILRGHPWMTSRNFRSFFRYPLPPLSSLSSSTRVLEMPSQNHWLSIPQGRDVIYWLPLNIELYNKILSYLI